MKFRQVKRELDIISKRRSKFKVKKDIIQLKMVKITTPCNKKKIQVNRSFS